MYRHHTRLSAAAVVALVAAAWGITQPTVEAGAGVDEPGLVAHEWGTFTTVADEQGNAVDWLPLSGRHDLPCFVDYFDNREVKILGPGYGAVVNYEQARSRLRGSVRMETPVIYFYADRPTTVDVAVAFPGGLFTEWYPAATVTQAGFFEKLLVKTKNVGSAMRWPSVRIEPSAEEAFPVEPGESHYYAARATDAAPVRVGTEQEKFLFYRGVGGFGVPVSAVADGEDSVTIRNRGTEPLPGVVLFTRHGSYASFRIVGTLGREVSLPMSSTNGDVSALKAYLHQTLVENGLYAREARAMLDTWGDTWFEEGTRVFYVMPRKNLDEVLPLKITPAPAATARVFVGRVEVITPDMEAVVAQAFRENDSATLARYGRLIGPIADRLIARSKSLGEAVKIATLLTQRLKAYAALAPRC